MFDRRQFCSLCHDNVPVSNIFTKYKSQCFSLYKSQCFSLNNDTVMINYGRHYHLFVSYSFNSTLMSIYKAMNVLTFEMLNPLNNRVIDFTFTWKVQEPIPT